MAETVLIVDDEEPVRRTFAEWLAGSGLRMDSGLVSDATLTEVGDPDILGAGDIVTWPHPLADGDPIRIEDWTVAAEQGAMFFNSALSTLAYLSARRLTAGA